MLFGFLKLVFYVRLLLHLGYYSINDWNFLVVFRKNGWNYEYQLINLNNTGNLR